MIENCDSIPSKLIIRCNALNSTILGKSFDLSCACNKHLITPRNNASAQEIDTFRIWHAFFNVWNIKAAGITGPKQRRPLAQSIRGGKYPTPLNRKKSDIAGKFPTRLNRGRIRHLSNGV